MKVWVPALGLLAGAVSGFDSFCATNDGQFEEAFREEFEDDTLNESRWSVIEGSNIGACRSALCTSNNVYIEDANGTSQGYWPAHWLMPDDDSCDPDEGEPDIMEMVSGRPTVYQTYHWMDKFPEVKCAGTEGDGGYQHENSETVLDDKWDSEFHEFSIERSATHLAFAVDGVVTLNLSATSNPPPKLWDVPFHLILNTAIGGAWPGEPDETTGFPGYHKIDYVRVVSEKQ
ncbi:hypothetical protein TrRE_jg13286 [Triparma retinervis]|uniref:GH16 domain-containing protein n=1 Tax=Triparma retinervis TaxID=2557542 RepID=A0A9W6ZWY1_9STRA|nr:hypothetical protein TrRE_jg13286 [Triparma retinervis]